MKVKQARLTLQVRNYFSALGRKGGKSGNPEDKRKAAMVRWSKAKLSQEDKQQPR